MKVINIKIIDGRKVSLEIINDLQKIVEREKLKVKIVIVQVGDDPASSIYVNKKLEASKTIGIEAMHLKLTSTISQKELEETIQNLNRQKITGYIIQLPLPRGLDENKIIDLIDSSKDIDGFSVMTSGLIMQNRAKVYPCTPLGIIELIKRYQIQIESKKVVVIGRSNIVGKPIGMMLLNLNATVTFAHSKTQNLSEITKEADLIIAAAGVPKLVTAKMVKPGAIIFDVGINRDHNNKLCGDVDFQEVSKVAKLITPVPGGVGPMTVAMLMKNAVELAREKNNENF